MAKMSILLNTKSLLDITLAAEGKFIKAHRVILAASSKYFEDLLFDSHEHQPMIFFRDVGFTELEVLVQFIYTGKADVPGSSLNSFLSLAKSLGVTGFLNSSENSDLRSPAKRKLLLSESALKVNENDKENIKPANKSVLHNSAPLTKSSDSLVIAGIVTKKRRTLAESKSAVDSCCSPSPQTQAKLSEPLYANTCPHPLSSQKQPTFDNLSNTHPTYDSIPDILPAHLPCKDEPTHIQSNTKIDENVDKSNKLDLSNNAKQRSNFSYDCHFPSPDELEAKGATLLHHLAVWMIQQQKDGFVPDRTFQTVVKDELPAPSIDLAFSPHRHSQSLPTRNQALISSSLLSSSVSKPDPRAGSEWDRPDSGFDSKDDLEEEKATKDEGSSPEIREISRQSAARQPILKKKRILQHRF